jgi:cysteine-rich repeat protein
MKFSTLILAGMVALGATPALADTVTLQPIKDNTLYEPIAQDGFADRSDGAGPTMFVGRVKDADADPGPGTRAALRRGVLAFDIAANIPAGATINSVQLFLYCDKVATTTARSVALRRLTSNWGEGTSNTGSSQQGRGEPPTTGDATWHHTFYPSQLWIAPGGDYAGSISASLSVGNTGFYTWGSTSGLVADVQGWLSNPSQNFGWVVIGDESTTQTTKRFGTRENTGSTSGVTWKPRLVVQYTPATVVGGCCQASACSVLTQSACTGAGGVYQGNGSSCSPNPCVVVTGACCAAAGTCSDVTQTTCVSGGGTWQGASSTCGLVTCPVVLAPYVDPLPLPPVATPTSGSPGSTATYNISMVEVNQSFHSQLPPTRVWAYNDGVHTPVTPGPIVVARTGMPVTMNWFNDLRNLDTGALRTDHYLAVDTMQDEMGMTCIHGAEDSAKAVVHLHGGHVPAAFDGYPENTMLPGDAAQQYVYPNDQQAGYLWFHDHALGITRLNVYMGLAGAYLVRDAVEDAINLPGGEFEVPLVIQDRTFNPDGSLKYPAMWMDMFFGDKIIVNGKVWPYFNVKKGKYRFRLLNGSTSRVYTLSLSPPSGLLTFTVVGNEGGLLEAPVPGVGTLTIGPGERYDVVVDFASYATGAEILLQNSAGAPYPSGPVDEAKVMKFRVVSQAGDTDPLPSTLRPIVRLDPATASRTRDFRLKQSGTDGCGRATWEINGLRFDDITEYPELGTTEIWRFVNDSGVSHPMHMHLVMFQVLDRDGFTKDPNGAILPNGHPVLPPAEESGWKDTVMVAPGEIARVIARFDAYKGRYPYHCHILEHEEHEMMRQFQTVSCGDGEVDAPVESCDDGAKLPLDGCSARCGVEQFVNLCGSGTGGSAQMTVAGITVSVSTTPGQQPAAVAAALAAAINTDPSLQGLGVTAVADGARVIVQGEIGSFSCTDAGLSRDLLLEMRADRLWWGSVSNASGYDVVRGNLNQAWSSRWDYDSSSVMQACAADNSTGTMLMISGSLAPGEGVFYLIRPQPGSYDEGIASQQGSRDAAIASSGHDCP